jgi:hypothetical protein
VWGDTKLPRLHSIFQILFNWEDRHLHEFRAGRRIYAKPDPDDRLLGRNVVDEESVQVNHVLGHVGDELDYVYDSGDNWHHRILLEAILLPEEDVFYPRCLAGERNSPPEDVGGPHSYFQYLHALADPAHERHQELLNWRGPYFPEAFSLVAVNATLRRSFHRRSKGTAQK